MPDVRPHFKTRPLVGWDKPKTTDPKRATFRAAWESTIDLLKHEAFLLDAQVIVCQIDVDAAQVRRDGMLRSSARPGFQGVKISMQSKYGPLTYATDAFTFWKDNVRATALGLGALRAVDRYGITRTGEQYRGFAAISDKPVAAEALTLTEAALVFADALPSTMTYNLTTPDGIRAAFRQAARLHHPDVGRDDGTVFRLITKARDVLLDAAE